MKLESTKKLLEEFLREREHIAYRLEHGELNLGDSIREDDACTELYAKKLRDLLGGDGR